MDEFLFGEKMKQLHYASSFVGGMVLAASVAAQTLNNEGVQGKVQYAQSVPHQEQLVIQGGKDYNLTINGITLLNPLAKTWSDFCNPQRLSFLKTNYEEVMKSLNQRINRASEHLTNDKNIQSTLEMDIEEKRKVDTLYELLRCDKTPPPSMGLANVVDYVLKVYGKFATSLKCEGFESKNLEVLPPYLALRVLGTENYSLFLAELAVGFMGMGHNGLHSTWANDSWREAEKAAQKVSQCHPPSIERLEYMFERYRIQIKELKEKLPEPQDNDKKMKPRPSSTMLSRKGKYTPHS